MWKNKPTLTSRVTLWLTLMSLGLFIILSFLTFLVTLSAEDSMIHNILRQVDQHTLALNGNAQRISYDQLIDMGYPYMSKEKLADNIGKFGEFELGKSYYHFMILDQGILLLDSTELISDKAKFKRVLKLLGQAFIPFLLLSILLARLISKRALRPFFTLKASFLNPNKKSSDLEDINHKIKEVDVKTLANELAVILDQKEHVLSQQITFNQGMSHELRTPLQVMSHSIELIGLKEPTLTTQDVYLRLVNSVARMKRLSEAMLWLNSNSESNHKLLVNEKLVQIKQSALQTITNHDLTLNINEQGKLFLPMPEEVFELIVNNLINNAIHHGSSGLNTVSLDIVITEQNITFVNKINDEMLAPNKTETNFGFGLSLVSKLCQRFSVGINVEKSQSTFLVKIS